MSWQILEGDVREWLDCVDDASVQTVVTSPPYWGLRDYGNEGQLGLEPTPEEYVANLVAVFREVRRVLRDDGTLWLNLGDSYAGSWGAQSRDVERAGAIGGNPPVTSSMRPGSLSATQIESFVGIETEPRLLRARPESNQGRRAAPEHASGGHMTAPPQPKEAE